MMSDSIEAYIQEAIKRRDEAYAKRDEAQREGDGWDDFIRKFEMLGAIHKDKQESSSSKTSPIVMQTLEVAREAMERLLRPIGISELLEIMTAANVPVGGKDPKATLDARLRYSNMFTNIRGSGWWLAARRLPLGERAVGPALEQTATHDIGQSDPSPGPAGYGAPSTRATQADDDSLQQDRHPSIGSTLGPH